MISSSVQTSVYDNSKRPLFPLCPLPSCLQRLGVAFELGWNEEMSEKKTHKNASSLITYHNSSCQRQQVVKELAVSQPRTCVVELSALGEVVIE